MELFCITHSQKFIGAIDLLQSEPKQQIAGNTSHEHTHSVEPHTKQRLDGPPLDWTFNVFDLNTFRQLAGTTRRLISGFGFAGRGYSMIRPRRAGRHDTYYAHVSGAGCQASAPCEGSPRVKGAN